MCFIHMQLSVGTGQSLGPQTSGDSGRNFHGCLENLLYNGHNLIELVRLKSHQAAAVVSRPEGVWARTTGADPSVLLGFLTPSTAFVRTECRCNHRPISPFIWGIFYVK